MTCHFGQYDRILFFFCLFCNNNILIFININIHGVALNAAPYNGSGSSMGNQSHLVIRNSRSPAVTGPLGFFVALGRDIIRIGFPPVVVSPRLTKLIFVRRSAMVLENTIYLEYEWQWRRSTLVQRDSADIISPATSSVVMIEKTHRAREYTNPLMSTLVTTNIECIRYLSIYLFGYIVSLYVGAKYEKLVSPQSLSYMA